MPSTPERIAAAIERLSRWMRAHDAGVLADNLAPGASPERLAQAEAAFGFPLPADLRALWALHDGQREEMNGFVGFLDLLGSGRARGVQDTVSIFVRFLREYPDDWAVAGITPDEVRSDRWVPVAARDSDSVIVSGVTGRVFTCGKDSPPLRLVADSLTAWWERYADRVDADDFRVAEGFGECHLAPRDRQAEADEAETAALAAADETFRQETPLLTQLTAALAKERGDLCQAVLEDALQRGDRAVLDEAIAALWAARPDPKLFATALQPLLRVVTLPPDAWVEVAVGAALLETNAMLELALPRCAGATDAGVASVEQAGARAAALHRAGIERVAAILR